MDFIFLSLFSDFTTSGSLGSKVKICPGPPLKGSSITLGNLEFKVKMLNLLLGSFVLNRKKRKEYYQGNNENKTN